MNGKAVRIHGVNRHDHDDVRGRAVARELMEADARLMKQFNVNAVRTLALSQRPVLARPL